MGRAAGLAWLLVLVFVGLAGCNAVAPGPETTVTPAPVPDDPDPPGAVAPGVPSANATTTGIDGQYVARVHSRTLQNTSYTVNQSVVQQFPNGTIASRYVTRGWFGPGDQAAVTLSQFDRGPDGVTCRTVKRFQEGTQRYRLVIEDGTRERTVTTEPGYSAADYRRVLANGGAVARVFGFVPTRVAETETVDGTKFVTLETVEPASVPPLENVTLTARISERNVIRSYRVAYRVERRGQRLNTTVSLEYTDIGTTSVPRPVWVANVTAAGTG
jgi:hypothetical protein